MNELFEKLIEYGNLIAGIGKREGRGQPIFGMIWLLKNIINQTQWMLPNLI